MPIFEFECPQCKEHTERITFGNIERKPPLCEKCGIEMEQVEFSVPAKRNPRYGVQT